MQHTTTRSLNLRNGTVGIVGKQKNFVAHNKFPLHMWLRVVLDQSKALKEGDVAEPRTVGGSLSTELDASSGKPKVESVRQLLDRA